MLQYFEAAIELVLLVACVAVFYYRRNTLIPLFRYYAKRFLGISILESKMEYRRYKSQLHAKCLNSHLRRLNVLEGKPARKEVNNEVDNEEFDCDGRFDCECPDCMSDDDDDNNSDSYAK